MDLAALGYGGLVVVDAVRADSLAHFQVPVLTMSDLAAGAPAVDLASCWWIVPLVGESVLV
jgi:hypothetical protein